MRSHYVLVVVLLLLVVFGILVFQLNMPNDSHQWKVSGSRSGSFSSQYLYQAVNSPIQPLPTVQSSNSHWVQLGKALFNSPLLSADNSVSCASCHDVFHGGDDGLPVSTGINQQVGTRNSPSVLNAVFNFRQFWDGRSLNLKDQAEGPIHNPVEMGSNWDEVLEKLRSEPNFVQSFQDLSEDGITVENILKAIVSYEESLVTENAPIDRYLLGEISALTPQQQAGYRKFVDYGCVTCHQGRNIGGNLYQKIGRLDQVPANLLDDPGRYELTKNPQDMHVFKVPSLRNVADTAPYFHNGSVDELSVAIRIMARGQLGLDLNDADVADLEALLHAFTGELPRSLQ